MFKPLKDMTLEELWVLFPIVLVPYNPEWEIWAKEEIEYLSCILSEFHLQLSHIGSTAIPGIQSKNIVDILAEFPPNPNWDKAKLQMEAAGYIMMSQSGNRMSFNKGYTPQGYAERVFHIHFRIAGDNDEICFRDYLRSNPQIASEYEALKLSLLPKYKNDRDGYTNAKTDFVHRIIRLAKSV